ncbi:sugar ABC transporter permease [Aerococcaceae bacterium zg-BR9]|nr:sugar ABC transporter permease [Aerococcaceae bacterium zg-1292]MBF6626571.1 sugar ABC transporter permease [Aerococcaceae bacterium zg-BR9]MBF6978936.1 sugar ABC transporter permease [Aerococcaceae bacterium zg-BR22]
MNHWLWGYAFVAPTIIGLMILNIIPAFQTLYMSFFKTGAFGKGNIFVGWENYQRLFSDKQVWQATWNTLKYTLLVVPITIVFALLLAVILNSKIKGRHIYRTIFFLPMVAAPAAVTMVWKWLYHNQFGLMNHLLKAIGLKPINWMENPDITIYSIAIIGIWSAVGYSMVLLLAGLQEIPKDYYEASIIDGASKWRQFKDITIPLLSPHLFFVFVTSMIQAMQVFDVIYMMIEVRNPAYNNTVSLVYLFYNNTFKYGDRGYGATIVMLLLLIIAMITAFQMYIQKRWVNYMGD